MEPEIQESEEIDEELRELRAQPASYDACRSLLAAVFLTAIEDYRIDLEEFKFKRDVDGRFNEQDRTFRDKRTWKKRWQFDAENWLFGVPDKPAADGFTLQQCCEIFDLNIEQVREGIRNGANEGS
jgi:hypothetical protein